jgi:hypothetical protein
MNKSRSRGFQPGNQFGQGRPKGSRNRPKPGEELLDKSAERVMDECVRRAIEEGDRTALRLCVERVSPVRRGSPLPFKLATIRSAQDAQRAVERVTRALDRGQCTPHEATEVMKFLQARTRLIEDLLMESRLDKLEQKIQGREGGANT